jgi:hypothetical protein
MTYPRKLTDYARAEIEALRANGVVLSDDEVINIASLGWEIENPCKRVSLAKGRPVKCGNVWLWPLTIHAHEWLKDCGYEMSDPEKALAYAMAHREAELYTVTESTVKDWFKGIQATIEELRVAMAVIIEQGARDVLPSKDKNRLTIAELAQMMVDQHGGTFDMWERQCSIDYVFDFLETTSKQEEAEKEKERTNKATIIMARYTNMLLRRAQNG